VSAARRVRLDHRLVAAGLVASRQQAQARIEAGEVSVGGLVRTKPGALVDADAPVALVGDGPRFVGRGGHKLEAALDAFAVPVAGRMAADLGASTGGFTDCLLQRGAARVFAVDVGYGQLAWSLRQDPRVVVMERTNARTLDALPAPISLLVGDLSFISLRLILPAVHRLLPSGGDAVLLIKPQFEAGPDGVGRGGRVRDDAVRAQAIAGVVAEAGSQGFDVRGTVPSPLAGLKAGNVEELIHLVRQ
jgi:23S rRNA (cytidine1920-2'-O)/16S rRNA (cytidine1409-2'-O)-methyltransferase